MKVALALMLGVACLHAAAGADEDVLKCYQCTDTAEKMCNEDETKLKACADKTFKTCSKNYSGDMPVRSCSTNTEEKCDETAKMCYCDHEACNAGHNLSPPSILGVTLLLSAARGLLM